MSGSPLGSLPSVSSVDEFAERYPPRANVGMDDMADMFSALVDGGIMLSKIVHDRELLPRQLTLYREMVRAVFVGRGNY